ncbi:MAG: sugar ABC transporter substrate-binding protein [Mesorhizobium sp.]|nr:MAG: sugar ABC transporter substrate-binding protein [Mesorhizobium sp.]
MHLNRKMALLACAGSIFSVALASSSASAEGSRVGYLATPLNNAYASALADAVQKFGKEQGLDMLPPKENQTYDPAEQINNMNTMLDSGVNGIVIQLTDSKALKVGLDKAKAAGVPVVTVDVSPEAGYGNVAMMVQVSSLTLGKRGCEELGKAMGGKGKALELQGNFQNQVAVLRSQGFNDCMKQQFPQIQILQRPADWSQDKAATITETVMSTDPDVNGIFMAGDSVYVSSVINVLRRLDRLKEVGQKDHIAITGIDGDPLALQAIRDGYVDAIISQPLTGYGKWGAYYLAHALKGETFKPGPTDHGSEVIKIGDNLADVLPPTVVVKSNVDDPELWGNAAKK